jgi:hypothetical protein
MRRLAAGPRGGEVDYRGKRFPFNVTGVQAGWGDRGARLPRGGRQRWSRAWPGAFVGDVIEQRRGAGRGERPLPRPPARYQSYCTLILNSRGSRIDVGVRHVVDGGGA